ncbi:MAG: hypothetical protein WA047_06750 [Phenylobacterium sp.]|uniref:hypothetical protein n=1 Tax=Phenylobacterium sp. TaxID=1871053 RepID=UPI003BB659F4
MFRLEEENDGWRDLLPGVRAQFDPVSPKAYRKASRAYRTALEEGGEDAEDNASQAFAETLIRHGLRDWEGIGDKMGKPLPFSPAALELFLKSGKLFTAADVKYVAPFIAEDAEKNASSPSRNGTSAAAIPDRPIAETAAKPARTARTRSTTPKPSPAKPPGK